MLRKSLGCIKFLLIFFLIILITGCDKRIKSKNDVIENKVSIKKDPIYFKNYAQKSKLERLVEFEQAASFISNKWLARIGKFFHSKNEALYKTYFYLRNKDLEEITLLFKSKKLTSEAAKKVHYKYQMLLEKELGTDLYKEYLNMLKDENIINHQNGIGIKIQF